MKNQNMDIQVCGYTLSLCYVSVADLEEESGNPYLSKISQEKDYCEVGRVDFMFLGLADF